MGEQYNRGKTVFCFNEQINVIVDIHKLETDVLKEKRFIIIMDQRIEKCGINILEFLNWQSGNSACLH